jgi:hypothetical protein
VAFRITCSENWLPWATPEWVKTAGAKGAFYEFGNGPVEQGPCWDPDFGDAVFLEKFGRFLAAMAARYDGNPDVAFVDIGSFGLWGEGHTHMSSRVPDDRADELIRRHIDLHVAHFPHTLLCISDDIVGHDAPGDQFPLTDYALSKGVTLRDDSIMVQPPPRQWYHAGLAQAFWPKLPVPFHALHPMYQGAHRHCDSAQPLSQPHSPRKSDDTFFRKTISPTHSHLLAWPDKHLPLLAQDCLPSLVCFRCKHMRLRHKKISLCHDLSQPSISVC